MTRKVGYGSPPDHTKWQKGMSGNPSGRPKGKRNFQTDLTEELAETISVTEGGRTRCITKQRALIKSLVASGLKGDHRASRLLMNIAASAVAEPDEQPSFAVLDREDRRILADFLTRDLAKGNDQ